MTTLLITLNIILLFLFMYFIKLFFFQQLSEKKAQGLMHASKFSTTVILEEPMFSNIMLFLDTFQFYIVM